MKRALILSALLILFETGSLYPDTIHVPVDQPTIQAGIDAAATGDTVLVTAGTYFEHIDFMGKAIVLKGEEGAEKTVIDGFQTGRGVTFQSGETLDSVIDGFTITNGFVDTSNGGGIDCTLESNPIIKNCVIAYNKADALGGGIACRGLSCPLISNCTFIGNISRGYYEGSNGGGLCCFILSDATVTDCVFIDNESEYGGAIQCGVSFPSITNCLFIGNVADKGGGAIDCAASDPLITNCTFVNNDAAFGGALSTTGVFLPSHPKLTNCILWDNSSNEIELLIGRITITYSDVKGAWPGTGNIDKDPLFADTPIDSSDRDLHLFYNSPCRDAGTDLVPNLPHEDFEGDLRTAYGTVDMGADEFFTHLYLTGDQTPGGDIQGKMVGLPGTSPVGLFIGYGVRPTPAPTAYGDFWLMPPRILIPLALIPASGILVIPASIPLTPSAPYDIPIQGLVGLNSDSLTNLCVLEVR